MPDEVNPALLSAGKAAAMIRRGQLTSEQLVSACAERISEREGLIGAWEFLDVESALRQARALDNMEPKGLLHGVPVGIKDLIDTASMPTAYGSPIYAGHHPDTDAVCVRRLRSAGAIVLGKTVTTEFAVYTPGKTRNPRNPEHTPGGSSSGSAAAVADGMVPVALGTQTGASVIRPASYCGVYGFKPSAGVIERSGSKSISRSHDTIGLFTRDVEDLALVAHVLSAPVAAMPSARTAMPVHFSYSAVRAPLRVGFLKSSHWRHVDSPAQETLTALAEGWGDWSGMVMEQVALSESFEALTDASVVVMEVELARALQWEYETHREELSDELTKLIQRGARRSLRTYQEAIRTSFRCHLDLQQVFQEFDVLVTPSVAGEAPRGLGWTGDPTFGRGWTLLGLPCVAVPGLRGPEGLPLGVQVIGPPGGDHLALAGAQVLTEYLLHHDIASTGPLFEMTTWGRDPV